jgi:hypothetical protein
MLPTGSIVLANITGNKNKYLKRKSRNDGNNKKEMA